MSWLSRVCRMFERRKRGPVPEPDAISGRNAIDWLQREHRLQQELCGVLEEIADALPGPVDPARVEFANAILRASVPRHIAIQQQLLFPLLRQRALADDEIDTLIEQITADNAADEVLAHDTADQLEAAVESGRARKPDMLAYMLRGLFEGRRRHIAWEMSVLIPLARERLWPGDLEVLSDTDIRLLLTSTQDNREMHIQDSGEPGSGCSCGCSPSNTGRGDDRAKP